VATGAPGCPSIKPNLAKFGEEGKEGPLLPLYHLGPRATCLCHYSFSDRDSFKLNPSLCRDSEPLHPGRWGHTHCTMSSPCISVCHWICLFVPLSKAPLYINLCKSVSGRKQQDRMPEWAQWVQDSLLQKHWSPSNAPCSLTTCSKGLTCSDYPGKQILILPPAEVHTLYVESHLESSKRSNSSQSKDS